MDGGSLPVASVRTTCPYCGVGCGILATPAADGGATIVGDSQHPANRGRLCSKGSALGETLSLNQRLLFPEIGNARVDWDTALNAVADGFRRTIDEHGPDAVAFYVSGQLLTEDYYVANKLIKGFLGTANIDTNSRLCMASSVAGHRRAFGSDTVPGTYDDLEEADLVVLVGSNLAWCHPILFQRLVAARAARPGLKIVAVDPRRTATASEADLHLPLRLGTDVLLFNGLLAHLARRGRRAAKFVDDHTAGETAALVAANAAGGVADVAYACGLNPDDVRRFYDWFEVTERTVTVYSQGVNQSSSGTDKVNAIINCHLFTGRIGRPGMGPFSVTGQPNAMGGREVGALANQLAAHMDFVPDDIDRVQRFWQAPRMATRPGLKAVDLFRATSDGRIKAIWIMATNPAVSLPAADAVRAALTVCPLVVVSDCARGTDTLRYAHIRLPALGWGEKDGTVTNSERRISRQRAFLPPPGEARADWWIVSAVAQRMGFGKAFACRKPAEIFREHAALSAFENDGRRDFDIGGLAQIDDAVYDTLAPVQWPVRLGGRITPRFFANGGFYTSDRRAHLLAVAPRQPAAARGPDYPLALNTGRVRDQWHTMTRTGSVARLVSHVGEPMVELHPQDAAEAGLIEGGLALVDSRWGKATLRVRITEGQSPGEIFVSMHWNDAFAADAAINRVVNPAVDPISGQPELKHTPVRLVSVASSWSGVVLSRRRLDVAVVPYWVAIAGEGHWRYELAGDEIGVSWAALAQSIEGRLGPAAQRFEYRDAGAGCFRAAWLVGGRVECCVFLGGELPPRPWLAEFLAKETNAEERMALLAGRGASGSSAGPIVCVCHGVGRGTIEAAIAAGADNVSVLGATLKAGTNCGSCLPELRGLLAAARLREVV